MSVVVLSTLCYPKCTSWGRADRHRADALPANKVAIDSRIFLGYTPGQTFHATHGICDAALVLRVDHGHYADTHLDGLKIVIILHSPGPSMADGNISVGLILDARATPEQQTALTQIATGQ